VDLGGGRVLVSADCPQSQQLFRERGFDPVAVDISEFQKLEGCVTCLSVPLPAVESTD
jgi:dimethylargininase